MISQEVVLDINVFGSFNALIFAKNKNLGQYLFK
jgi:hypothetical protein